MYPLPYLLGLNKFRDGAWYDPSWDDRIGWALQLLKLTTADKVIDIGSGDGRVVVAMAKIGAQAVGIEKDIQLVEKARAIILQTGLKQRAHIIHGDMWQQSYQDYHKVFIYQFKSVMERMEEKLLAELPSGASVVSNYWRFPHWQVSDQLSDVYLYTKK